MTVDRPRVLEPCPERPEHHFLLYPHTHAYRDTRRHAHTHSVHRWLCEPPCHRDKCALAFRWGSVNHTAATQPPTSFKMNGPTLAAGNNPNEAILKQRHYTPL